MQVRTLTEGLLFLQTITMAETGHQLIPEKLQEPEEETLHQKPVRMVNNREV